MATEYVNGSEGQWKYMYMVMKELEIRNGKGVEECVYSNRITEIKAETRPGYNVSEALDAILQHSHPYF
jgi:hypothetical protein